MEADALVLGPSHVVEATWGCGDTCYHSSRASCGVFSESWKPEGKNGRDSRVFWYRPGLLLAYIMLKVRKWVLEFQPQLESPLQCSALQTADSQHKEYAKSFSSSMQAGFLSVWILSQNCRCLSYFLLEFDGIIKGYCCHSKEGRSWSHFLSLLSNVNKLNLTAQINRRVHL